MPCVSVSFLGTLENVVSLRQSDDDAMMADDKRNSISISVIAEH